MEEEIEYSPNLLNNNWKPEDIEYIIRNASHFTAKEIAQALGRGNVVIGKKLHDLGLAGAYIGRIEAIDGIGYIPEGATTKRVTCGTGGTVLRFPTSTPGIVSRTIHLSGAKLAEVD